MKKTVGIVFSNVYDTNIGEITKNRTMASLPFAGRYRHVDFILSNMVNSNIKEVGIVTKSNYQSLMDHLNSHSDWEFTSKNGGLFILPPFDGMSSPYGGKIDALYGAMSFLSRSNRKTILLSDSNIICNIDFREAIEQHAESDCDVTIIANYEKGDATTLYNMVLSEKNNKVIDLAMNVPAYDGSWCSMGMYLFKREYLIELVKQAHSRGYTNLERDVFQRNFLQDSIKIGLYKFEGTVLRNDNIASYYKNNLRMLENDVRHEILRGESPIYTKVQDTPPTVYGEKAVVDDCLIADGCEIEGMVSNSIMFRGVKIGKNCVIKNSVLMQSTIVEDGATLENVILDKNCIVTANKTLAGADSLPLVIAKNETV